MEAADGGLDALLLWGFVQRALAAGANQNLLAIKSTVATLLSPWGQGYHIRDLPTQEDH